MRIHATEGAALAPHHNVVGEATALEGDNARDPFAPIAKGNSDVIRALLAISLGTSRNPRAILET
jgi:hypothetical protein